MIDGVPPLGQFRWQVQLQSSTVTADGYGQPARGWSTYSTGWAFVEPQGLSITVVGDKQTARSGYRLVVRYVAGVLASHRVLWDGRTLQVNSVVDLGTRRRFLELLCEELADVAP